jgi:hypothetical protein
MITPAVTAPFFAAAALLAAAGGAKVLRPGDTATALGRAGFPLGRRAVRIGAAAEAALGLAAFAVPGPVTGSLVCASYVAFTVFVVAARSRGWALSSCGCFGRADSKPTYLHAALDAAAAVAAAWWALEPPRRLAPLLHHQPWNGAPLALVSLVIAALAYLIWTNPVQRVAS